jgi:hypothetical protein
MLNTPPPQVAKRITPVAHLLGIYLSNTVLLSLHQHMRRKKTSRTVRTPPKHVASSAEMLGSENESVVKTTIGAIRTKSIWSHPCAYHF